MKSLEKNKTYKNNQTNTTNKQAYNKKQICEKIKRIIIKSMV